MRKLKLELTDLEVTSFQTHRVEGPRGTVQGQKLPTPTYMDNTCNNYTCGGMDYTCEYFTCVADCYESGAGGGACFSWPYTGCADCAYESEMTCAC